MASETWHAQKRATALCYRSSERMQHSHQARERDRKRHVVEDDADDDDEPIQVTRRKRRAVVVDDDDDESPPPPPPPAARAKTQTKQLVEVRKRVAQRYAQKVRRLPNGAIKRLLTAFLKQKDEPGLYERAVARILMHNHTIIYQKGIGVFFESGAQVHYHNFNSNTKDATLKIGATYASDQDETVAHAIAAFTDERGVALLDNNGATSTWVTNLQRKIKPVPRILQSPALQAMVEKSTLWKAGMHYGKMKGWCDLWTLFALLMHSKGATTEDIESFFSSREEFGGFDADLLLKACVDSAVYLYRTAEKAGIKWDDYKAHGGGSSAGGAGKAGDGSILIGSQTPHHSFQDGVYMNFELTMLGKKYRVGISSSFINYTRGNVIAAVKQMLVESGAELSENYQLPERWKLRVFRVFANVPLATYRTRLEKARASNTWWQTTGHLCHAPDSATQALTVAHMFTANRMKELKVPKYHNERNAAGVLRLVEKGGLVRTSNLFDKQALRQMAFGDHVVGRYPLPKCSELDQVEVRLRLHNPHFSQKASTEMQMVFNEQSLQPRGGGGKRDITRLHVATIFRGVNSYLLNVLAPPLSATEISDLVAKTGTRVAVKGGSIHISAYQPSTTGIPEPARNPVIKIDVILRLAHAPIGHDRVQWRKSTTVNIALPTSIGVSDKSRTAIANAFYDTYLALRQERISQERISQSDATADGQ